MDAYQKKKTKIKIKSVRQVNFSQKTQILFKIDCKNPILFKLAPSLTGHLGELEVYLVLDAYKCSRKTGRLFSLNT